ncbi:MAG: formylmethanofuran dehydrogenase subunit B [Pirellulaceae bacterium]
MIPHETAQTTPDVACTLCGCVCDDLTVTTREGRVVAALPHCPLAEPWWLRQSTGSAHGEAHVAGRPVPVSVAVAAAAEILRGARAPLFYGLSRSSTPGQRAAVCLADSLGATIDTTASTCHAPSIMAVQSVGESTATLGEIKNRSDLVIYWGSDPLVSHPRHLERLVDAAGLYVPAGRRDRHLVVVDVVETETARRADTFVCLPPGSDFELIWALRAAVRGVDIARVSYGGLPWPAVQRLAERMRSCRYGAVFFGLGLTRSGIAHANVEALLRLVTDLNAHTRFVARRMRILGDVAGADSVLSWHTGYPFSVNLARGYPRYNPGEYSANSLLERSEVDAVLLVGSEGVAQLTPAAQQSLSRIPSIVLDYPSTECPWPPAVHFTTAIYGVHRPGTAYRMDEVPVPLRQILSSPLPADHEVLDAIRQALQCGDRARVSP